MSLGASTNGAKSSRGISLSGLPAMPALYIPCRWQQGQQRQEPMSQMQEIHRQKVASVSEHGLILDKDSKLINHKFVFQDLVKYLVRKGGIVPPEVEKGDLVVVGRLAFYCDNLSKVTEDQQVLFYQSLVEFCSYRVEYCLSHVECWSFR